MQMSLRERERAIRIVLWGRRGLDLEEMGLSSTELIDFLKSLPMKRSEERQGHEIEG